MPRRWFTRTGVIIAVTLAIPISLFLFWWIGQPFGKTLLSQTTPLSTLSGAQRQNIAIASARLNGVIIEPGNSFSFNRVIGPRTAQRGYQAAPSYIADGSPKTLGGGICLLSSAIYGLALRSGLQIQERHPHLRPIKSIPPGLDAAVWYGQADVIFRNNTPQPLQVQALIHDNSLQLRLLGKHPIPLYNITKQATTTPMGIYVTVNRFTQNNKPRLVSRDYYRK